MSTKSLSVKLEVEKFDVKINFSLWQVNVQDFLSQQGLHKALKGKLIEEDCWGMLDHVWKDLHLRAISVICSSLVDHVLYNVMNVSFIDELWKKLEASIWRIHFRPVISEVLAICSLHESTQINDYLTKFSKIICELSGIDVILKKWISLCSCYLLFLCHMNI